MKEMKLNCLVETNEGKMEIEINSFLKGYNRTKICYYMCKKYPAHYETKEDYSEDEALDLLDQVREAEVSYSQCEDQKGIDLYTSYCLIGDKIFNAIPS